MNDLTKASVFYYISHKAPQALTCLALSLLLFGCASSPKVNNDKLKIDDSFPFVTDTGKPKSIFVFMDGTRNNQKVPTNIYRLFKEIKGNKDKQTVAIYIEGVGSADSPIAGAALGFRMEDRIKLGYAFLTEQYQPGDSIYLFGFSRGAHTARSLAGLIAYAGIPKVSGDELKNRDTLISIGNELLELTKNVRNSDYIKGWEKWQPGDKPPLTELIREERINGKKEREVQPAEVKFLGVWDTVPGSIFKGDEYFEDSDLSCEEKLDWKKTTPIIREIAYYGSFGFMAKGERYKSGSYPAIRQIAHAVSNDEKRSMFRPLFLCPVINDTYTKTTETVFPGAHADVGGGYEDLNNELPSISLNWMIDLLGKHYRFPSEPHKFLEASPKGLAHLSISDYGGSAHSNCRDRKLPELITKDPSINERENAGLVPLGVCEQTTRSGSIEMTCEKDFNLKGTYQRKETEQKNVNCGYITQQKYTIKEWDRDQ